MPDYTDLFDQRGSSYDRAMQAYPAARDAEFRQLLEPLDLRPGSIVGDVPAGGGYLGPYIPRECEWVRHEPCSDFVTHAGMERKVGGAPLLPFPFRERSIDALVSLAGVHHLDDKRGFYREARRVVREDGDFVLSDVAIDHPVARFLDDFVGAHNSTGHDGVYLDEKVVPELEDAGWTVRSDRLQEYLWVFKDRSGMIDFTRRLFDIDAATDDEVAEAIDDRLGTEALSDGGVGMRWALRTLHCRPTT